MMLEAPSGDGRGMAVVATAPSCVARAQALAMELGLPLVPQTADWRSGTGYAMLLLVGTDGISIGLPGEPRVLPVRVDLASPAMLHRLRQGGARSESVARALGMPAPRSLGVVDATAGLGSDSAVLAALGCEVTMIERHPAVAALLADGLSRLQASTEPLASAVAGRLRLLRGDALAILSGWNDPAPDVVLLDPMFPERGSSAAVRKEMRLFQRLVGEDPDAPALLAVALELARFRVAVKRPRGAPPLAGPAPSHSLDGRSTRFDVYVRARIA